MTFYVGMYRANHAWPFRRVMISARTLKDRKRGFYVNDWILDSGAFTQLSRPPFAYTAPPEAYADEITRYARHGRLLAAVTQDFMCEPMVRRNTGATVAQHQEWTVERYVAIAAATPVYVMPVLQGWETADYVAHLGLYGDLLKPGAWVGVGSICKRSSVTAIEDVLSAVHARRPDLRLHGFGVKLTALVSGTVRALLHSADSMAWSFNERRNGRDAADPRAAARFAARIEALGGGDAFIQPQLFAPWPN